MAVDVLRKSRRPSPFPGSSAPWASRPAVPPRPMTPRISRSRASFAASDPGRHQAGIHVVTTPAPDGRAERSRPPARRILGRIGEACARAGRDPAAVTLLAVSKTVPAEVLRDAVAAGLNRFGENRVQEAVAKAPGGPRSALAIGRAAAGQQGAQGARGVRVDPIGRFGGAGGAARPPRRGPPPGARYPVLLQVNVDDDPAKAGFQPGGLEAALDRMGPLGALAGLEIRGLMTIGRLVDDPEAARPPSAGCGCCRSGCAGRVPRLDPTCRWG